MAATKKIPTKYDKELLDAMLERDGATLQGSYKKITRNVKISFKCSCGEDGEKCFRYIVEDGGARCKKCSSLAKVNKAKETNVARYGVSNVMHLTENKLRVRESQVTYTYNRLTDILGSNLIGKYDPNTMNKLTLIKYHCIECNAEHEKAFDMIVKGGGPYCKKCCHTRKYQKIKDSLMEKYGVEYSLQVPKMNIKAMISGLMYKDYFTPSGNVIKIQGYEGLALDMLFKQRYKEEDIITDKSEVPEIWWVDADGKFRRYYVDIYIKSENRMIEVKSDWTYKKDAEKIEFLWRTCVEEGYKYEVMIFDKHHKLVEHKVYDSSSSDAFASTSTSSNVAFSSSSK